MKAVVDSQLYALQRDDFWERSPATARRRLREMRSQTRLAGSTLTKV